MLRVIGNKVLVEPLYNDDKNEYKTNSGIIVQSHTRGEGRLIRAKVLGVGSGIGKGKSFVPMSEIVNVGDIIMYYKPSAQVVKYDNKEYTIIRAEDIDIVLGGDDNE